MTESDLYTLFEGTADAAFIVGSDGLIRFWNRAATEMFGLDARRVLGRPCWEVIDAHDQTGTPVCSADCRVREPDCRDRTFPSFDAQVRIGEEEPRWLNITSIRGRLGRAGCFTVHLARDIDARKRLENVTRSFLAQVAGLSGETVEQLLQPSPPPHGVLTGREREIARLLASGNSTASISRELSISAATVRNHVRSILTKLEAHSRTEAVLRAIREKLL